MTKKCEKLKSYKINYDDNLFINYTCGHNMCGSCIKNVLKNNNNFYKKF